MRVDSLYICPWSLNDPLCRSQSLAYVRGLVRDGYKFAFITLEIEKHRLTKEETDVARKRLAEENIFWYPVRWDSGTDLRSKFFSLSRVIAVAAKAALRHRPRLVHSRSSMPAFPAVLVQKLFRTLYLYDADSLLSEEYADTQHILRESYGFRFLARAERAARTNADHIIVLTEALKRDYIEKFKVKVPVDVIPCCVETARFLNGIEDREMRRRELGLTDEPLLIYVGKAGSWYAVEEIFQLLKAAYEIDDLFRLLIISRDDPENFHSIARRAGIAESVYLIRSAEFDEVGSWMSAADAAISFFKPSMSKRGTSPVKVAEYLASGLPIIANRGIGDIDELIAKNGVGVLIDGFDGDSYLKALKEIEKLGDVSQKCRDVAMREFDLEMVGGVRYRNIYSQMLD